MEFGNLKNRQGLEKLNSYLADKSYIDGYTPSQADVSVFMGLNTAPPGDLFHALRWYNHINSYSVSEREKFPGEKKLFAKNADNKENKKANEEDDDFDLFGSEDEDEAKRVREERIRMYEEKKAAKPKAVAKSSILLDVKPWDDQTDMEALEKCVRSIQCDGLVWGGSKLVPVAFGVKKLQIICIVEDEKISTDFLEEEIMKFDDYVQSVDIAAFNKV